jgi:hypothetical protein
MVSRFPDGSSANNIVGLLISARATATRCSLQRALGLWLSLCDNPRKSNNFFASASVSCFGLLAMAGIHFLMQIQVVAMKLKR